MSKYTRWEQGRHIGPTFSELVNPELIEELRLRVESSIYVVLEKQEVARLQVALCADSSECARIVTEHNAMIDRLEHLEKLAAQFIWEEEKGPGKIDPAKPWCEPCVLGNCRKCLGYKVCGHYHGWKGEDEELAFCGKLITTTFWESSCRQLRGHRGDCWASR